MPKYFKEISHESRYGLQGRRQGEGGGHSVQNGEILQRNYNFFQNQTEWLELIFGLCPFRIWHF